MKKALLMALALSWALVAIAQSEVPTQQMKKEWRELKHKRNIAKQYLNSNIPLSETINPVQPKNMKSLPEDRVWFPGEWEEVQAIVVTPYYEYAPATNQGVGHWMADPLVTGVATYYRFQAGQGWVEQGEGPYKAEIDTTNNSFGNVFYYLMDAIQLGGAEAWVRIENQSDSGAVIRKLQRMNLRHDNVKFIVGPGNSFWYRDCGPICFYYGDQDSVAMLDFEYYPGRALDDSLPSLIYRQMDIPNYITTIEWEGGNCLVDGVGMLVTSDATYSNNADSYGQLTWDGQNTNTIRYSQKTPLSQAETKGALQELLGQRSTYVLPAFRYDGGTGHIDLYVDMCDENSFVFSQFPDAYNTWTDYRTATHNIDSLCSYTSFFGRNYGETYIPFPSRDNGSNFTSQAEYNNSYTRTYSNHTFVNNVILQPCFSQVNNGVPSAEWDRANIEELKKAYPGYTIYPINVRDFDGSGGAIHCITKQIPAENPVRILHKTITGAANDMMGHDIPVSAIITNKSGIANAQCHFRINEGNWDSIALTANGNRFSGLLPTAGLSPYDADSNYATVTVEYYISATSNNGKTMTKPITAAQGGYFNFYLDSTEMAMDSTRYDFETAPVAEEDITFVFSNALTQLDTSTGTTPPVISIDEAMATENAFGQFYPNPSNSQAHIDINLGNAGKFDVSIVDAAGRIHHKSRLEASGNIQYTINVSSLSAGVYTIVFSNHDGAVARRLIVK